MMYGWWAPFGGLMMFAFFALIVWLIVAAVRPDREAQTSGRTALDVLDARFARGEIDDEEYRTRRSVIEGSI